MRLAKRGAVLLIDDLDEGPGPALAQAERDGVVEVIERRMFNRSTMGDADNPCLRRVRPPLWSCKAHWGWAAARYVGHATVRRSAREARGGVGGGEDEVARVAVTPQRSDSQRVRDSAGVAGKSHAKKKGQ